MSQPTTERAESGPETVVESLRPRTGTVPLPPPPPLAWYFRQPTRWIARAVTAAVCLSVIGVWYENRTCDVVGQATDLEGRPLPGVVIRTEDGSAATVSDERGAFCLSCRGRGLVWIVAEVPGISGAKSPVELVRGKRLNLGRVPLYAPSS